MADAGGESDACREVLEFWFPEPLPSTPDTFRDQVMWWMRGGATDAICSRFAAHVERAVSGEFDDWAATPLGRLALILLLDQFTRSVYRGTLAAYAQDPKACALALEALENGHFERLPSVCHKMFVVIAIGHNEGPDVVQRMQRSIQLSDALVREAPEALRPMFQFSAQQPREHLKVLERFGRYPHRNAILGRKSTAEELDYLGDGRFPHERELPEG
ncbi:MAG: DUF924 family protein [Polyangiaceae bacterium]